jgi:integrase
MASILKAAADKPQLHALIRLMRYCGLAILDAVTLERSNVVQEGGEYRICLTSRQKTSKHRNKQAIDNAIPASVGRELLALSTGRWIFWDGGPSGTGTIAEKRSVVITWHAHLKEIFKAAGLPDATAHKFRHTLAIEMIRHGASFEDVAAALGNTQGRTDKSLQATW